MALVACSLPAAPQGAAGQTALAVILRKEIAKQGGDNDVVTTHVIIYSGNGRPGQFAIHRLRALVS